MTPRRGKTAAAKRATPAITAVERSGAAVRLTVAIPGSPDLVVLASAHDGTPAWGRTRHLDLRYEGAVLSPEQTRVLRGLAGRLRDVPFEHLLRNASGPAEAPAPSGGSPGAERRDRTQEVVTVEEWGSPDRWRTFLFRREFARNASSSIRLLGKDVVVVSHGESECEFATPRIDGRTMGYLDYPWVRPRESEPGPTRREGTGRPRLPGQVVTDLRDAHIITGGTARLEAVLDALAPLTEREDLVLVRSTCVPRVIGDDMEGAVERWRGRARIRYDDVFAPEPTGLTSELMAAAIASGGGRRTRGPSVSIAGLALGPPFDELTGLLREAGIAVRGALLPDVDLRLAPAWRTASVQVLLPNPYYRKYYEQVFAPLGMRTIAPPPPYGISGTRAWLEAVGRACGRGAALRRAWRRAERDRAAAREGLRRECAEFRLGFVVGPAQVAALFDPMEMAGVPALDAAIDLGFGIDLLVFDAGGGAAPETAIPPGLAEAVDIYRFRDREALRALLRDTPCAAVYSDLHADERVTQAGKTPFSLQAFEPGLAGALRTGERLLGACRLPFYRKYAARERPPAGGRRPAAIRRRGHAAGRRGADRP